MNIYRRFRELNAMWELTTLKECKEHTEGSGYYKPGTVENTLKSDGLVFTPFCDWKTDRFNLEYSDCKDVGAVLNVCKD